MHTNVGRLLTLSLVARSTDGLGLARSWRTPRRVSLLRTMATTTPTTDEAYPWGPDLPAAADVKHFTLAFVFRDAQRSEVLLGLKKRGFGEGLYNGFGGKVEPGETPTEAAARELEEESGVRADLQPRGTLIFTFKNVLYKGAPAKPMCVHVFDATEHTGEPTESEEMAPEWFLADKEVIPFDKMWPDDHIWLPIIFEDCSEEFLGVFHFDDEKTILSWTLECGETKLSS